MSLLSFLAPVEVTGKTEDVVDGAAREGGKEEDHNGGLSIY